MSDPIRDAVERSGYTHGQIAVHLTIRGVPMIRKQVTDRLTGRTDWRWPEVCALADLLDVPLDDLRGAKRAELNPERETP